MTRHALLRALLSALALGGCHVRVAPPAGPQPPEEWPALAAARLALLAPPAVTRREGGPETWLAAGRDPRLPLPLGLQPRDRDFLALIAAVSVEDLPDALPGLPTLLVEVGAESRQDIGSERSSASAFAFARGFALVPVVTDRSIGWLASFARDASPRVVADAAALLTRLAAEPTYSASDLAACAEALVAANGPSCGNDAAVASAVGLPQAVRAPPAARTLAQANREDLVRLQRRVFVGPSLTLVGTRAWPDDAATALAALGRHATAPEEPRATTPGLAPGPRGLGCPQLRVIRASVLAVSAPDELATPGSLDASRFAQLAQLLDWLDTTSLRRLPELRQLNSQQGPIDVIAGTAASFEVLEAAIGAARPELDVALAPLGPARPRKLTALLTTWLEADDASQR